MAQEIKAEVYQLSVYDPLTHSPSLSLSLLFRHLERDTGGGVENDLQEVTPTFFPFHAPSSTSTFLPSFLSFTPRDVTGHCFLFQHVERMTLFSSSSSCPEYTHSTPEPGHVSHKEGQCPLFQNNKITLLPQKINATLFDQHHLCTKAFHGTMNLYQ